MKFRGIFAILAAMLVVAATAATANAAKLVYTQALTNAQNSNIPVGDVLYTIALQTTASDGTGSFGISLTFTGVPATSPIQIAKAASGAISNVQSLEDASQNGAATLNASRYADSWFYSSTANGGQVLDLDGNPDPTFVSGGGLSANPFALAWNTSNSPNSINNTTGAAMSITGLWGNPTSGDPAVAAASLIGPGLYPIAQLLVPANSTVPIASGASLGIATPSGTFYNVLGTVGGAGGAGAFVSGDPNAYKTNALAIGPAAVVPEPATFVLAGLAAVGVVFASRRRK